MNLREHFEGREPNDLRNRKKAIGAAAEASEYMPLLVQSVISSLKSEDEISVERASSKENMVDHIDYKTFYSNGMELFSVDTKCKFVQKNYLLEINNMWGNYGNLFSQANGFLEIFLTVNDDNTMLIYLQVQIPSKLLTHIKKILKVSSNEELRGLPFTREDMRFAGISSIFSSYRLRNTSEDISKGKIDKCICIPFNEAEKLAEKFELTPEIKLYAQLTVYDALKRYSKYTDEQLSNLKFIISDENRFRYR